VSNPFGCDPARYRVLLVQADRGAVDDLVEVLGPAEADACPEVHSVSPLGDAGDEAVAGSAGMRLRTCPVTFQDGEPSASVAVSVAVMVSW
jgi:hypothetical protein